jgi:NAD(P)-dependent dehydrogenase (short-subunit alcohol dehydrogenase family)
MSAKNRLPDTPRAFITGGGSGLGRALALNLAKRKARLLVGDINLEEARKTVAMVEKAGGKGKAIKCDVTDLKQVEAAAVEMEKEFGGIDLLVNNAGVAVAGYVGKIKLEDWKFIIDINLWGVIYGCHVFIPRFKERKSGHILNVASAAGFASLPEMAPYNVSKAGVVALSETLFSELYPDNIRVTVLCPGFFKTNLMKTFRSSDERQKKIAEGFFARSSDSWTPERVAMVGLKALESGKLHATTDAESALMWRLKRLSPQLYFRGVARSVPVMTEKLISKAQEEKKK